MRAHRGIWSFACAVTLLGAATLGRAGEPSPAVEQRADALVKRMSDFLAQQKRFSVVIDHGTEVVTKAGQVIEFDATSQLTVERPNKIRSDRRGEVVDVSFYYDGKTMAIMGHKNNYYATAAAPPTIDEALAFAGERIGVEIPSADLIHSNPYRVLREDAVSGTYIGAATVDGVACQHVAFRGNETDWQLWIEDGARPLPRKYVIRSKKVAGSPSYSIVLRDWKLGPTLDAGMFTFAPPPGAERISFVGLDPSARRR
jgi:hypothetical protein